MTTDPIEQAQPAGRWSDTESWWRMPDGSYAIVHDSIEQAILRYHPDVVRLVLAARWMHASLTDVLVWSQSVSGETLTNWDLDRQLSIAQTRLVPFKEVQE